MKILKNSRHNIDPCGNPADIFVHSPKGGIYFATSKTVF